MSSVLPEFRKDLEIIPRAGERGRYSYIIKNPESETVFELGEEEYFLCAQLDGRTELAAVQAEFKERFDLSLTADQLEAFVRQLEAQRLLVSKDKAPVAPEDANVRKHRLLDPDPLFKILALCFSWCFSRVFAAGACLVLILALGVALKFGGDFFGELRILWRPGYLLVVPVLGILLANLLGEIAKGVACKHYGGHVHEFGVVFLYRIVPRFYCDISDVLWVMRKPDRIRILSVGMACQLVLAGVSMVAWENIAPRTSLHTLWFFLTLAFIIFFFLNGNPLGKRDGYYLLSTWLEIPDMRNRAIALARSWILRRPLPEPLTTREIVAFKCFGVLAVAFEIAFWTLVLGLTGYFLITSMKGIGALLFLVVLGVRFEGVLKKQCGRILPLPGIPANEAGGSITLRRMIQIGVLAVIVLIMFVPYPFTVGGEFRILPGNQLGIRAQVSGEIKSVLVKEGEWVKEGQPVAVLLGRDQEEKAEETRAALDEVRARLRLLKEGPKPEEIAKAKQEVKTAAKALQYSKLQADRYGRLIKENAVSQQSYEYALKQRDLDKERLELAKRNLELVKSGARDEEIKALEAEVRRLEVDLAHAEEDLRLTTLFSPAEGRIITPYLQQTVGQSLRVGDLLAVVEDARTIIAEIKVPEEDVGEVRIGSGVKLKSWAYPTKSFRGQVSAIAPVAHEMSRGRVERTLSEREWRIEQEEILREKGKVVRVLSELHSSGDLLKTDMTGYAKIECEWKPVGIAFTRWLVRFILVEVWSWIP